MGTTFALSPNISLGGTVGATNEETGVTARGGLDFLAGYSSAPIQFLSFIEAGTSLEAGTSQTNFMMVEGAGLKHSSLNLSLPNNRSLSFLSQFGLGVGGVWSQQKNMDLKLLVKTHVVDFHLPNNWNLALIATPEIRPNLSMEDPKPRITISLEVSNSKEIKLRPSTNAWVDMGDNFLRNYFSPKKEIPPKKDISEGYAAYHFADGVLTEGAHSANPPFDSEVILFQPIALRDGENIIKLDDEKTKAWVTDALTKLNKRGFPVDKLTIYIRKQPKEFDISDVDTTGKNTAVPLKGAMEFDQEEKLTYFGYHSKTIAYSYHIIPSHGRSQARTMDSEKLNDILGHPEELVHYIHPGLLIENLGQLKGADWKEANKVGQAFLNSLWDGENFGWEAAITHITEMEGSAVDIFVGKPDKDGNYSDKDSPEVFTHESGHSMLKLMDEYGSGEYTAAVKELRKKYGDGKIPDSTLEKMALFMVRDGETPPVLAFINDLSPQNIVGVFAQSFKNASGQTDNNLTDAERKSLRALADILDGVANNLSDTPAFSLAEVLQEDLVKKATVYPMMNVDFSEDDLWNNFNIYVAPSHSELRGALCVKEGGLQEMEGTFHFEYKKEEGCENTIPSNMKNSHSSKAPNSPWAEALLSEWNAGTPYCQRLNAPVSGFQCEGGK